MTQIQNNFTTIKQIFNSAWQATKKNAWYLCIIFFSLGLIIVLASLTPLGGIVQMLAGIAITTVALAIAYGKTPTYADTIKSFTTYKIIWHYFLATLLYGLIILVGFILLILPGIYFLVRFQFYKFIVIDDENIGPVDALKKSFEMTKGHFWFLLGFILTIVIFNILGLLVFIVGLIVTIPVSMLATAILYKKLLPENGHNHTEPYIAAK